MAALTIAVAVLGFIAGQIVSYRMFFRSRARGEGVLGGSLRASSAGFATMVGTMGAYLAIGNLLWRLFN